MLDPEKSLYHRLGGYDAIAAFSDEFLSRALADRLIGVYWKGKSKDSLRKERQLLVDFLCAATGGPVNYTGRDMKTSHEGLRITEQEWDVTIQHIASTLDDLGVAKREKDEVLAAATSLKGDIVELPQTSGAGA